MTSAIARTVLTSWIGPAALVEQQPKRRKILRQADLGDLVSKWLLSTGQEALSCDPHPSSARFLHGIDFGSRIC